MPSFENIDPPDAGTPTRATFAKSVISNLGVLYAAQAGLTAGVAANGSFEIDADEDLVPDQWTFTEQTNGTGAIDATVSSHGGKSFKITRPNGVGNGGGSLESTDFFECSKQRPIRLQWAQKADVAGMRNKVEIRFFDRTQAFISTVTLYNSVSNPTSWTIQSAEANPPANAAYAKIKLTGGDSATNPGSTANVWFDDVVILQNDSRAPAVIVSFSVSGTWTCPDHITRVRVRAWGAGGGGGSANGAGAGGGGGAGGYSEGIVAVVPNTAYAVTVGVGGAGGAGNANDDGGAGGSTSLGSLIQANGGTGGTRTSGGGSGGAGGAATGADFPLAGEAGTASGGDGGFAPLGGRGGIVVGSSGRVPGGGGAGSTAVGAGGNGANGRLVIEY